MKNRNERDGNWLDPLGCCRVCNGEFPCGHTENCDIWKMEKEIKWLKQIAADAGNLVRRISTDHSNPIQFDEFKKLDKHFIYDKTKETEEIQG